MTLLARPDTIFEANFFNTDDGQSWTDLSGYVELQEGISISRRRQLIFDDVGAGSFKITLDNTTGIFNNERADLDFFNLVTVDVPVRYRARWPRVPTDTVNMVTQEQSLTSDSDAFTAEQGTLTVAATVTYTNLAASTDNTYFTVATADGNNIFPGQQFIDSTFGLANILEQDGTIVFSEDGAVILIDDIPVATIYTVTSVGAPSGGNRKVTVTPNLPTPSAINDTFLTITTSLTWATGVLQGTGIHVLSGDYSGASADPYPMYVKPSTQYTASVQVIDDTAGTGISFQVSARILWYDKKGQFISESTGTPLTLTTSYQAISVTATSPSNAYTARMSIANETLVNPASATIALTGTAKDVVNRGGTKTHLTIPAEVNVGDLAIAWHYANSQPTFSVPVGWTFLDSWNDNRGKTQLCYKILTAKDIGQTVEWTIDQTGKHWLAMLATYSGVNQSTPINQHARSIETVFRAAHTTPNVTTTVGNCWIIEAVFDVSTTTVSWATPAGRTSRVEEYSLGGNAVTGIHADNGTAVATGTYGSHTYTASANSKFASMSTLAIAPATGTGPGSVLVSMGAWQFEQNSSASAFKPAGYWRDLFTGLTDSWTKTWMGDNMSLMEVNATDRSKQLASNNVGSAVFETIKNTAPVAYYVLDEQGDPSTTEGANSADTNQPPLLAVQVGTGGTLEWAQGIGPAIDGVGAVVVTKSTIDNGMVLRNTLNTPVSDASAVTLMCWFTTTDTDTSGTLTLAKVGNSGAGSIQFGFVELRGSSGTNLQANTTVRSEAESDNANATYSHNYFDGKTHFACATYQLTGTALIATLYVDGVQVAQNSALSSFLTFPPLHILDVAHSYPTNNICSGTYSHVALLDYALDDDTIADIYTAGTTAYAGDTVDQRIGRIATWAGIDNLNLENSDTICDRHLPATQTAMDAFRQAARTDGGTVFVDDNGGITFKSRAGKEDTVSPWIIVDSKMVDAQINEITDDQLLVNQATIKRLGANSTLVTNDLVSQTAHGINNKDIETIQKDAAEAQYYGDYLISFYSEPKQRCDSVILQAIWTNQWDVILTQQMWDVIRITNMPNIEASSQIDLYIEGWAYDIDDMDWRITYDTSAAIPFAVLNDSTRGVVGNVVVAW